MEVALNEHILIIEAFYGGSHKQLIDVLEKNIKGCVKFTLPAKKWHWKARTSALYFAETIPASDYYRVLFCSSVLNLPELVALRPDLASLKKVVYFHENQLEYPVRNHKDRDFQYGYNQILSCLVADKIVFNSEYNMTSFLGKINSHLKLIPDHRPKGIPEKIRPKCSVLYFPMIFESMTLSDAANAYECKIKDECENERDKNNDVMSESKGITVKNGNSDTNSDCVQDKNDILETNAAKRIRLSSEQEVEISSGGELEDLKPIHIVWPHRWEHDKAPEVFFETLMTLKREKHCFRVSVLGETFTDVPEIFAKAKEELGDCIVSWGYLPSREDYIKTLRNADIVVSTAKHEFFGVAMIEAAYLGCYPLCPNRLVYPEIFPKECLYNTDNQLLKRLKKFCNAPNHLVHAAKDWNLERFSWQNLAEDYKNLLS